MSNAHFALAVPALYFLVVSAPLAYFDLKEKRLPNRLTLPGIALALLALVVFAILGEPLKALLSFVVALALFALGVFVVIKGWLGMGDVKLLSGLALVVGAFDLGYTGLLVGVTLVVGIGYAIYRIVTRTIDRSFALGPGIILSYLVCLAVISAALFS
jgi:leader peptidase (prepilin peptidase)/N-methyltransferase